MNTKTTKGEVTVTANIHAFILSGTEREIDFEAIREYIKTGNLKLLKALKTKGVLVGHKAKHNIIVTAGRHVLAQRLTGTLTNTGTINYGALGTGATPSPVNGSTQLQNEVFRKIIASHSDDGANTAYVDFYYAPADCNGTYTEFGNVIDGTASANTGVLWSYFATGGWTKTSLQGLFISCQYTFN